MIGTRDIALEKQYHAMLEVVDPIKGALVQRLAIPGYLINAMPGPKAALYSEDDQGNVTVRIVSYALDGR